MRPPISKIARAKKKKKKVQVGDHLLCKALSSISSPIKKKKKLWIPRGEEFKGFK
jgi:hypothetical protein